MAAGGNASADTDAPLTVAITGAAGQIGYTLCFMVASGAAFGEGQRLVLHLLDLPAAQKGLDALQMELQDIASPLVDAIVTTTDPSVAFAGADFCLLVGARPRGPGMERKDLLEANASIFRAQGAVIAEAAKPTVRVVVVGNPANTNALVAATAAEGRIDPTHFSALTFLDQTRLKGALGARLGVAPRRIHNAVVWGNHSAKQFPDASAALVQDHPTPGAHASVASLLEQAGDGGWARGALLEFVRTRGAAVIKARGLSSAGSAATAICGHCRALWLGSGGRPVSLAVRSDGNPYGVADGLYFSFPVVCKGKGEYEVMAGWSLDAFAREQLRASEEELVAESAAALAQ